MLLLQLDVALALALPVLVVVALGAVLSSTAESVDGRTLDRAVVATVVGEEVPFRDCLSTAALAAGSGDVSAPHDAQN